MINLECYKITEQVEEYLQARIQATLAVNSISVACVTQREATNLPADYIGVKLDQGQPLDSFHFIADGETTRSLRSTYPCNLLCVIATERQGSNTSNHSTVVAIIQDIVNSLVEDQALPELALEYHVFLHVQQSSLTATLDKDKNRERDVTSIQYDLTIGVRKNKWIDEG